LKQKKTLLRQPISEEQRSLLIEYIKIPDEFVEAMVDSKHIQVYVNSKVTVTKILNSGMYQKLDKGTLNRSVRETVKLYREYTNEVNRRKS